MYTNFTVIAYRPNGADCYRGHVNGRSDSDFVIEHCDNYSAAAEYCAKYDMFLLTDQRAIDNPRDYADYEVTVLLNGVSEDNLDWDALDYQVWKDEFARLYVERDLCRDRIKAKLKPSK